jgi:hypothetical protein
MKAGGGAGGGSYPADGPVSPAVGKGGDPKKAKKRFGKGGKFGKGGSHGGFARGGGVSSFAGGKR